MPRAGQVKPPVQERLSDRITIGVLTATFPPALVDRVVAETGRTEQRHRLLPARVVVYLVLALALFSGQAYEEVARLLTEGLAWAKRWRGAWQMPTTKAITRARQRLGAEPLRRLFVEVAGPLATQGTQGAWYRGWRVLAIDGTTLDVPDSPANQQAFGRPATHRGSEPPSRRSACWGWPSAAPTRSWPRSWGRWPVARRPWRRHLPIVGL
jgi:Insertion element 4 transposase N-terminal